MNQVSTAPLGLTIALLTVPLLGDVATTDPFRAETLHGIDRPGSYGTRVLLRVADSEGRSISASVEAFECRKGFNRTCQERAQVHTEDQGTLTLHIPKASEPIWIRITSANEYAVIYRVLPDTIMGTIDLGTIVLQKQQDSRTSTGSDWGEYQGTLLDEDDKPIEGVQIYGTKPVDETLWLRQYNYTDANGRVAGHQLDRRERVRLNTHVGRLTIGTEDRPSYAPGSYYVVDSIIDPIVKLKEIERIELDVKGKKHEEVNFSLYEDYPSDGHRIPLLTIEKRFAGGTERKWLRVTTDESLSRLVRYPETGEPLAVDFSQDKQIAIEVRGSGSTLPDARVDIVEARPGYRSGFRIRNSTQHEVDSLQTDNDGRVLVRGDPSTTYMAYAYADGHLPNRSTVHAGGKYTIVLDAIDKDVTLRGFSRGEVLRVKVAGSEKIAYFARIVGSDEMTIRLASGTYDATIEKDLIGVTRGRTFEVTEDGQTVDLSEDSRPLIKFSLPPLPAIPSEIRERYRSIPAEDVWFGTAYREVPPRGGIGFLATSWRSWPRMTEPPPQLQVSADGTPTLRLHGTGEWYVDLTSTYRSLDYWLVARVVVGAATETVLVVPTVSASIVGEMHFDTSGFHHHGIAGPRLMLLPLSSDHGYWSVVVGLPEKTAEDNVPSSRFRVSNLPVGEYRLEHQLEANHEPGWGGYRVSLEAETTTNVGDITRHSLGPVIIEVVNSKGRFVNGRILQIRDRLYDSWANFTDYPTSGVNAEYPLQEPPRMEVEGTPVTLHSVRVGWLELTVDDQLGVKRHYLTKVPESRNVRLLVD